jgi:hypothetical protein
MADSAGSSRANEAAEGREKKEPFAARAPWACQAHVRGQARRTVSRKQQELHQRCHSGCTGGGAGGGEGGTQSEDAYALDRVVRSHTGRREPRWGREMASAQTKGHETSVRCKIRGTRSQKMQRTGMQARTWEECRTLGRPRKTSLCLHNRQQTTAVWSDVVLCRRLAAAPALPASCPFRACQRSEAHDFIRCTVEALQWFVGLA